MANNNPGRTGLNQSRGIIFEEFLPELRGRQWYKKADEMRRNNALIASALLAIEMPIRDIDFYWESDEGEEDPRLELLEAAEKNLSHTLAEHISEGLGMLWAGFSVFAVWYERVNGQVLWRKFLPLGQDTVYRWNIDDEGGINGLWQYPYIYPDEIPIDRLLLYRTKTERNNPEGWSLLRPAYIDYYFSKNLNQVEAISLERGGAGYPVIKTPQGADLTESSDANSDYGRAHAIVRNVRIDEQGGVIEPPGWEFRFEHPNAGQPPDFDKVITRHESRMMLAMMTQFLLLGQGSVGTQALSGDQTDFFTQSVNAIADVFSDMFTRHVIPKLMLLNGQDPDGLRLAHSPAGDISLSTIADFLQKVGNTFITWTPQDETWLRAYARLPEMDEQEIATLQDEKDAREAEMLKQLQPNPAQQGQPGQPTPPRDPDKMGIVQDVITEYATARATDEKTRNRFERQYKSQMRAFLEKQQARIVKAARSLK